MHASGACVYLLALLSAQAMQAPKGSFENNQHSGADLRGLLAKAQDDLNPLRVRTLLHAIPPSELPLLDMDYEHGHPVTLLIESLLVPPVPIRPSVMTESASGRRARAFPARCAAHLTIRTRSHAPPPPRREEARQR